MTTMPKWWPSSRGAQAGFSVLAAIGSAIGVFIWTNNSLFAKYAREFPYDGQDSLGAMMGALEVAACTLIGVSIAFYLLQRFLTKARN
jgi:hypothetical protein